MVESRIHRREIYLANTLETSATTNRAARFILDLEQAKPGEIVVDLGSGACPLVADLLSKGIRAYGVDWMYQNPECFKIAIERYKRLVLNQIRPEYRVEMERATQVAAEQFWQSFTNHPEQYRAEWLTQTSFDSNFADRAVSLNALSDLAAEESVFYTAFREGLRITKPGKSFVMAPFHTSSRPHSRYFRQHARMVDRIKAEGWGTVQVEKNIPGYWDCRLRVTKA